MVDNLKTMFSKPINIISFSVFSSNFVSKYKISRLPSMLILYSGHWCVQIFFKGHAQICHICCNINNPFSFYKFIILKIKLSKILQPLSCGLCMTVTTLRHTYEGPYYTTFINLLLDRYFNWIYLQNLIAIICC